MQKMFNYAFHYVAGAYGLAFVPHVFYVAANLSTTGKWGNISPRQNWDGLASKLPPALHARCVRARNAHLNALEQAPLFAAAMVAAVMMKVPTEEVNRVGLQYVVARLLYTFVYIAIDNEALSMLRTAIWVWSLALPINLLLKAGFALNTKLI